MKNPPYVAFIGNQKPLTDYIVVHSENIGPNELIRASEQLENEVKEDFYPIAFLDPALDTPDMRSAVQERALLRSTGFA